MGDRNEETSSQLGFMLSIRAGNVLQTPRPPFVEYVRLFCYDVCRFPPPELERRELYVRYEEAEKWNERARLQTRAEVERPRSFRSQENKKIGLQLRAPYDVYAEQVERDRAGGNILLLWTTIALLSCFGRNGMGLEKWGARWSRFYLSGLNLMLSDCLGRISI